MNERVSTAVKHWPSTKVGTKFFDGTHWTQCDYGDLRNDITLTSEFFQKLTGGGGELIGFCVSPCLGLPALILSATISSCPFVFLCTDAERLTTTLLRKLGLRWLVVEGPLSDERFNFFGSLELRSTIFMVYQNMDVPERVKITYNEKYLYATTTSGSTGDPKVVRVPEESILPNVLDFSFKIGLTSTHKILLSTALTFDPAILEFFLAIINGAPLIIVSKDVTRSPTLLLRAIQDGGVAFYQTTPSLFKLWNKEQKRTLLRQDSNLKVLVLGGERFPSCVEVKKWQPKPNVRIYNTYGLTEVSCWATLKLAFPNDNWKNFSEHGLDIGESLSETQMMSTEDPSTELHHLMIGSSTRICAVENETFGELISGKPIFRFTGDLFKVVDRKYYFCYRNDAIVKRLGKKINVSWIEEKCHEIGLDCAVSVRSSNDSDDLRLVMFIVGNRNSKTVVEGIRSLKKILPGDHWPDMIDFVDNGLPLSPHGKLDRIALESLIPQKPKGILPKFVEYWNLFTNGTPTGENRSKGFVASGGNSFTAVLFINSLKDAGFRDNPNLLLALLKDEPFSKCWRMLFPKSRVRQSRKRKRGMKNDKNNQLTKNKDRGASLKIVFDETRQAYQALTEVMTGMDANEKLSIDSSEPKIIAEHICPKSSVDTQTLILLKNSLPLPPISLALKGLVWPQNLLPVDPVWTSASQSIQKEWSVDLLKCIDASPLAVVSNYSDHSFLIVGSHSGLVAVLKCDTGEKISQTKLPDRVEASACISSDHSFYYIGCYDGNVYRICIADGKIVWSFKTQDQVKSACVLHLDKLFVGSYDKYIHALTEGGDLSWKRLVGPVAIPVLPFQSSIFVGTLSNMVWRLSTDDGSVLCKTEMSSPLFSNLVLTTYTDYQSCVLVSPVEGPIQWRDSHKLHQVDNLMIQGSKFASPVIVKDGVTIIASDKTLHRLQYLSTLWSHEFKDRIVSTPFVIGTRVVVITIDGTLYILNDKGTLLCTFSFPGEVFSSPVVVGSRVFVGCRDNNFYCLKISS